MTTKTGSILQRVTRRVLMPVSRSQPPKPKGPVVAIALYVLLDATGSMAAAISGVIKALLRMVDIFVASQIVPTLGLVVFRDEKYGEQPLVLPLGSRPEEICNLLKRTTADGGGDEPESSLPAIMRALDQMQHAEPGVKRIILHITDAPPHDPENGHTSKSVLEALKRHQAVYFACAPAIEPYKSFANVTGGTLFQLEEDMSADTFRDLLLNVAHQTVATVRSSGPAISDEARALLKSVAAKDRQ